MLLSYLSLPFYIKNSNFLYWMVPYHTEIYPDKILRRKNWYFWYNWKKCDFVFFGNVSITYNINECVHKINCIKLYTTDPKICSVLVLQSYPHFVYGFSRKMILMLYSFNVATFTVWLPLLLEILGNMYITIGC